MYASTLRNSNATGLPRLAEVGGKVDMLQNFECPEALAFLDRRPANSVFLAGLIHDNGLQSPLNRGIFYGYRNCFGELEGIALIGHATLFETSSDQALCAFAAAAQRCHSVHLIMCEEDRLECFWGCYAGAGQEMRRAGRQLLLELRWPVEVAQSVPNLRPASSEDLDLLVPVHARMALDESGVDPREHDAEGFNARCKRRVEQGRTWVLTERGKLQFKADIAAETPQTIYIEGVWVNPHVRGQGYGRRCMSQLARELLSQSKSICLFVNDDNEDAQRFYKHAGYHLQTVYDTIFLK